MAKISQFPQSLGVFSLDETWYRALEEELNALKKLKDGVKIQVLQAFRDEDLVKMPQGFVVQRQTSFWNTVEIYTIL